MHLRRIREDIRKKVITGLLILLTALGMFIGFKNQQDKINDLEHQLQLHQIKQEESLGTIDSRIDVDTVKGEFNKLVDYTILKDYEVSMKHSYDYSKDWYLGLKKEGKLVAYGTVVYDVDIRLSNANVYYNDKGILMIELEKPFIDENSVHLKPNSMLIDNDKSNMNILSNDKDGKNIMKYWQDTFVSSAIDKLNDWYKEQYQQDKLNDLAKQEIERLLNTLEIKDYKIQIKG